MRRMNRFFLLTVLCAILVAFGPVSCSDKPEKIATATDAEISREDDDASAIGIAQQLQGVKFTQSKGDQLLWKLDAKEVEQVAEGPIKLRGVEITYYSDNGRVIKISADTGSYDAAGQKAKLEGHVKVRTSDGGQVETNAVQWDQKAEVLTSDSDVTISRGDSILTGTGFVLRPSAESFRIYQVGGTLHKGDAKI